MRKHTGASWFLHILLPAPHADSMLGDLLELSGNDEVLFRRLFVVTSWSLLSRSLAGFLLAATVGGGGMVGIETLFFKSLVLHAASHYQQAWGSTLGALAGCLLIMACFSMVGYGAHDRMTQLTLACIPALAAASLFWWVSGVPATAGAFLLSLFLATLIWRGSRNALLAVAVLLVLQFLLWFFGIGILLAPLSKLFRHAPANAIALKSVALTAFLASYVGLSLLMCVTYSKVRRWVCD